MIPAAILAGTLAITGATVIDGTGAPPHQTTVIVRDGRIAAVGRNVPIPAEATRIDGRGKFLIPGLWDMHVHLGDSEFDRTVSLATFIANGVTGIRIMEGAPVFRQWRTEVEAGRLTGPRMVIASPLVGETPLTPDEARAMVRQAKSDNADFIKVHDHLSREAYFAVIEEAKRQQLTVAGHVPPAITAAEAARAGQKSIEHLTGITDHSAFADFLANGTWQCPTLVMRHHYALLNDPSYANDPRLRFVKPSWRERWQRMTREAGAWPPEEAAKRRETIRREDALVGAMQRAGIGILAGTDDANPYAMIGFGLHDELELLVGAGLAPMEALQAATRNAGRFLGMNAGTIEKGALADLVLLDRNPLEAIGNTRLIRGVIANGRYYDRRALDDMLAEIERTASASLRTSTGLR